jgi:hypothetical protein
VNWVRVIESLIGTLAGGLIALASLSLKDLLDRWRASQAWYEQYYVTEGIERLRSYFMMVEMHLIDLYAGGSIENASLPPVPYEAITRVVGLLDCRGLLGVVALLTRLRTQYKSRAYVWDCIGVVKMVGAHLDDLSRELAGQKIRIKTKVHFLAMSLKISALRDKLEKDIELRSQQMDAFLKRHPECETKGAEAP